MNFAKFSILYTSISILGGCVIGLTTYFSDVRHSLLLSGGSGVWPIVILTLIALSSLVVIGFRILNGGAKSRRKSAIVLVVVLAFFGSLISIIFGAVASLAFTWLFSGISQYLSNVIPLLTASLFFISWIISLLLSPPVFAAGFLASVFGLPLSRIASGETFIHSWNQPWRGRLDLFWRASLGSFLISLVVGGIAIFLYYLVMEPIDLDSGMPLLSSILGETPSFLEEIFHISVFISAALVIGWIIFLSERQRNANF